MTASDYGWAAVNVRGAMWETHRTRAEAITAIVKVFAHADASDPGRRRRAWNRLKREGWRVVWVVTHTLEREYAVDGALTEAARTLRWVLDGTADASAVQRALLRIREARDFEDLAGVS